MKKGLLVIVLILVALFSFSTTQAQVKSTDIVLQIIPEYPSPGASAKAVVSSYVTDLNKAIISWSINGEEKLTAIGQKNFEFTVAPFGRNTRIEVEIYTADGQTINKSQTIASAGVDLLWQGVDVYVPPFYRGRSYVGKEGRFKVVAMPNVVHNNNVVGHKSLSYSWKEDGEAQTASSGWGKNFYLYKASFLDSFGRIGVTVSDTNGTGAQNEITLNTSEPKIVFYKKDRVFGNRSENAIQNGYSINPSGETIVAIPYFFYPKNLNSGGVSFVWSLGGQTIQTPRVKNEILVAPDGRGSSSIKLEIRNTNSLFQKAEKEINVNF